MRRLTYGSNKFLNWCIAVFFFIQMFSEVLSLELITSKIKLILYKKMTNQGFIIPVFTFNYNV